MKSEEKSFKRDDIVYREGDAGDAVYVVAQGRVEILKAAGGSQVIIASLGPGEMFGEMGVLDDGPRNASAICVTDCVLKVVPKDEFRAWVAQDEEAAGRVIKLLVDRLRFAQDIAVKGMGGGAWGGSGSGRGLMLLDALVSWIRRRRPKAATAEGPDGSPVFHIGVAQINNDVEGAWGRALLDLLAERPGIAARAVAQALVLESRPDQAQAAASLLKARNALAREGDLDLLIWGDVHAEGFTLCLTPAGMPDDERPGTFNPYMTLELAGDLEAPVGDLLALAALAAIEPLNDAQRGLQHALLPSALQAMSDFLGSPPVSWSLEQQRTALICYGHAAATIGGWEGADWYDHAADAYRAAINRLPAQEHGLARALSHKYLGLVLSAAGEKRQDNSAGDAAVEEFRESASCFARGSHPQEWAAAQIRLGLSLYKLDHLTSHPDLLKEALSAFQGALQVFTRADAPQRWADTMFNLAQVLLVYGDQMKNTEVLERAVDAARAALDHRSRDRNPVTWAATENALGTALFLLDKHGRSADHVDEAKASLKAAAETYRSLGLIRQAKVAEKNLQHVEKLPKPKAEKKLAKPDWAEGAD